MTSNDALSARERLIETSYDLFTHRGICDVGVDEVVAKAGVAKATLYRHFPSKDDLVLAFLDRRAHVWTSEVIDRLPRERAKDPEGQLLALFDVLDGGSIIGATTKPARSSRCSSRSVLKAASARHVSATSTKSATSYGTRRGAPVYVDPTTWREPQHSGQREHRLRRGR